MAHSMIDVHAESYNSVCMDMGHSTCTVILSETSDWRKPGSRLSIASPALILSEYSQATCRR